MADIVDLQSHYIGSPAPGVYLHNVPNATMQVLEDIINATWSEGKSTKAEFSEKIASALSGFLDTVAVPHVSTGTVPTPAVVEPSISVPSSLSVDAPTVDEPVVSIPSSLSVALPTVDAPNVSVPSSLSVAAPSVTEASVTLPSSLSVTAPNVIEPSVSIPSSLSVASPTINEPTVLIPSALSVDDLYDQWKSNYLELAAWLAAKFTEFRANYFPDESAAYTAAEDWLQAAIANPEVGLPPAVAAQIWGDDQARILSDKTRAQDTVVAQFAARRFPLPPGAAASAVIQIEQKAQDEVAESSRKVAIMSVEMQKFSVEKILDLRKLAMDSAVDYIKALASGPDMASRMVGIGYDLQTKLISAAAQFYTARANAAEIVSKAAMADADVKTKLMSAAAQITNARTGVADVEVKAASADADAKTKLVSAAAQMTNARTGIADVEVKAASADANAKTSLISAAAQLTNALVGIADVEVKAAVADADVKTKLVSAAAQMMNARVGVAEVEVKAAVADADVKTKLMSASAQLTNARTSVAELAAKAQQYNNSIQLDADTKNQAADLTLIEDKLKALLAEAQAIAQMATSLFNNLHVGVTMQANGSSIISQSNEF